MVSPVVRIDAIRYARHERTAGNNFTAPVDDHDLPMPLDYFVWAIHRQGPAPVIEGLRDAGIDHLSVEDVILTHLHYDHAGSLSLFPNARFHVQDAELAFATSRHVCDQPTRAPFDGEPVAQLVRKLYADHVVFHDGDQTFAPGIDLRICSGHTAGLQVVVCETARGPVVLASDAAHLYANVTRRIPFPIFVDEAAYARAQARVMELAGGSLDHVIPGHDPLVLECFPSENDIARVDLAPLVPIASTQ